MLEAKIPEKDRFLDKKLCIGRGTSQLAQPVKEPVDRLLLLGRGPVAR